MSGHDVGGGNRPGLVERGGAAVVVFVWVAQPVLVHRVLGAVRAQSGAVMAIRPSRALVAAIVIATLAAPACAQSPPRAPGVASVGQGSAVWTAAPPGPDRSPVGLPSATLATATAPGSPAVANEGGVAAGTAAGSGTPVPGGLGSGAATGGAEGALPGRARVIALTFDDGPDPTWTPRVLALLRAAGVHATFCLIGREVAAYPRLVARIVADGHRLCNHTFDHDERLATRPVPVIDRDIQAATAAIDQAVPGAAIGLFRAPGGAFTGRLDQLLPALGLRPLGWSVDPDDWRRPGAAAIVARVLARVRPGSIILLHDGGGDRAQTVAALRQLLPALTTRGYQLIQP